MRTEGQAAVTWLGSLAATEWEAALIPVTLPVVLSDGAGPYLLDAAGRLILAVAPHPRIAGARVAMGPAEPRHPIGLVRPAPAGAGWRWIARAEVMPERRLEALDALDALDGESEAEAWAARADAVP